MRHIRRHIDAGQCPKSPLSPPFCKGGEWRGIDSLIRLTKQRIRSKILLKLKTQREGIRNKKSNLIKEKLFRNRVFKRAKTIMIFISFGGEVETMGMIKEAEKMGKIVAVPVCRRNKSMRPSIFSDRVKLTSGLYEVYEPAIKKFVDSDKLDLVIVPGVAFDRKGNRLGRGKGYYDRFLARLPSKTAAIGLAFDFQILPLVPTTRLDKKVNRVIFA